MLSSRGRDRWGRLGPPKGVWNEFCKEGPWGSTNCFWTGFWEGSGIKSSEMEPMILNPSILEPSVFKQKGSTTTPKQNPQSHRLNCPPVSFAPMVILSPISSPPINIFVQIVSFGRFRLVNLMFDWPPLEDNSKKQDPIWGVNLNTQNWLVGDCVLCASLARISFFDLHLSHSRF